MEPRQKRKDHGSENDKLPAECELVWNLLLQLDACKYMGLDRIPPAMETLDDL